MRLMGRAAVGVAIIALAGTALAGCSSSSADSGPVTITYVTGNTGVTLEKGEQALIDSFQKQNPDIKVKVEAIPFADYDTKLTTELRSGAGPDVGRVNHTDVRTWAAAGFLSPLDDAIRTDKIKMSNYIPGLLDIGKVKGQQLTLPLTTDARAFWYNPTLLKKAGISSPPKTWDDLVTDAKKFNGTGVYGFAFSSDNDYSLTYESLGPWMKVAEGKILNKDGTKAVSASSNGTVAAAELLQSLVKAGVTPPGENKMTGDTLAQLFSQNKLAFMLGGPWQQTALLTDNPKAQYGVDYATTALPVQHAGQSTASVAGGWQIGIFKNSKNKEAAGKLVAFLAEPSNLKKLNALEAFPPIKDGLTGAPWNSPFFDAFNEVLPHSGLPMTPVAQIAQVSATFESTVLPSITDPSQSAKSALKSFDDQVNSQILGE